MPNVISNTSPLQYLHQLNLLELLSAHYQQIIVPQAVVDELSVGRQKGISLPEVERIPWIQVRRSNNRSLLPEVADLGSGEREVLALGLETTEPLLILDDALARKHAQLLSLPFVGTLGILLKAKASGHIPAIKPVLDRLDELRFRLHADTRKAVLKLASEE